MWNKSGYENSDQGGGYMNSQGDTQGSSDKKKFKSKNLVPCSIGRLLSANYEDDQFVSDGVELNQVLVVGLVVKSEEVNNYHLYSVSDMSAPAIEVRHFIDNESDQNQDKQALIAPNTYIYAMGILRSFGNKRSITAFKLRVVTDLNELTSHLLECMHAHAHQIKARSQNTTNQNNPLSNNNMALNQQDMGLSKNQMQVLNCVKSSMHEHGMTIDDVTKALNGLPKKQIIEAIEFLSNEGHVYSTIDDDHFKATDM